MNSQLLAMCMLLATCAGQTHACDPIKNVPPVSALRPVATYSIVARDPETGEIGVAVQSHWFSVGSVVPWAEAGVGAVATQSMVEPAYGPNGLELMRAGKPAPEALKELVAADTNRDIRQVALIDAAGRVAAHTGSRCIAFAGREIDREGQFSVQANLMSNEDVWPAMAHVFRQAKGDLADRLIAALEAAEKVGGDVRGRQSAAIVVVAGKSTGKPWIDRKFDLRVEDHPQPVVELKRLVKLQRAYLHMNAGDLAIEKKEFDAAGREYAEAARLAPDIVELPFWHAVALVQAGKANESLPIFREVFQREPSWIEIIPRLREAGFLPDDEAIYESIKLQHKSKGP